MRDLILLCLLFLLHGACFLAFHIVFLRFNIRRSLLSSLIAIIIASIAFVSLASYFLLSSRFSTFASYVLSAVGTALVSLFAFGLYSFLGPVTADRSFTFRLIIFLAKTGTRCRLDDILQRFDSKAFMEKRIKECLHAKIIAEKEGAFILTYRGYKIAKMYLAFRHILRLQEREGYRCYFRKAENP